MRKLYFFVLLCLLSASLSAQVIDFEDLTLPTDSFWNGSDQSGGFTSGNAYFSNSFTDWGNGITSWSGFAYSNMLDTVIQSYSNQYSCYAGTQTPNSTIFGLSYNSIDWMTTEVIPNFLLFNNTVKIQSIDVTNSTYAALTMLNGDMYSKKFGGPSGNDPDWFKLTIKGYLDNTLKGVVEFYLADYRFTNNDSDYIVKQWTTIDISSLGVINKLAFSLSSSDTGTYGMNTPAYFCFDNIRYQNTSEIKENLTSTNYAIYPNPAQEVLYLNKPAQKITVFTLNGKKLIEAYQTQSITIDWLPSGLYVIEINDNQKIKLIKL